MSFPAIAWAFAKRHIGTKAVKKAATKAFEGAATDALAGAIKRGSAYVPRRLEDRKHRRLATDEAQQIGGQVSLSTVIAGDRYHVVWRGSWAVTARP